jgi:hypothetical protein
MAEILKPKDIAKILEAIPENKLVDAASELNVTSKQLSGFIKKPTNKVFEKIAETLGEGVEGAGKLKDKLQSVVDKFLKREPTELEKIGEKFAAGGGTPPPVSPGAAKEVIVPPGPTEFQMPGQPGGPLATMEQPGQMTPSRLGGLGQKLEEKAPLQLGPAGRRDQTLRSSLGDEFNASMGIGMDEITGAPMSKVPKKAAGLGAVTAAGAAVLASAGFSKEANAPAVVKEAALDKVEDIAPLVQKAVQATEPDKQAVLLEQAQQLQVAAQSIEDKLTSAYEKKQARVELMKLTETVMSGLVTAIGANALLNRNSPFAVDFSQGPKTDWNAQFDRLQKDYTAQMGLITQKYKIEAAEKRAQAAEAGREARFQQEMQFKREELGAKEQAQQTAEISKLNAVEQKQYKENLMHFGDLRRAITDKKPGAAEDAAIRLRADEPTIQKLKEAMNQGLWDKVLTTLNLSEKPTTEQILQGLRPTAPAAPTSDLDAKRKRMEYLLAKQKEDNK